MTSHPKYSLILAALLSTVALSGSSALAPFPFQPESRLWLEGSSTVRGFTCRAGELEGRVIVHPGQTSLAITDLEKTVRSASVSVPVGALDCGNGTMEGHLRKALKAPEHPLVRFQLSSHSVSAASEAEGKVSLNGTLQIAGQEKPVVIEAVATREPGGALRVRGSEEVVMTEFGVKPPSLMMGTMKVRDRVTVHFDVVLKP